MNIGNIYSYLMGVVQTIDQEEFEDTKEVIRICILKNRQHNGQKKKGQKDKQRSTKHTHKTKDRVTRTPLKTGLNSCSLFPTDPLITH